MAADKCDFMMARDNGDDAARISRLHIFPESAHPPPFDVSQVFFVIFDSTGTDRA